MSSGRDHETHPSDAPPSYESHQASPPALDLSFEGHPAAPPQYQATDQAPQHSITSEVNRLGGSHTYQPTGTPREQADWRPPEFENLECLDALAKKAWNVSTYFPRDRNTFRNAMMEIYLFERWHDGHFDRGSGNICNHVTAFQNHLRLLFGGISNHQLHNARNELVSLFRNPKNKSVDPSAYKLRAQMDDAWEKMPELFRWRWVREWCGTELDPWEFSEAAEFELEALRLHIKRLWENPAARNLDRRVHYDVIAQIYLCGRVWSPQYIFEADRPTISFCEYLNENYGKQLFTCSDLQMTWYELLSKYKDSRTRMANDEFTWRMDRIWERLSPEERAYWKTKWRESEAAAKKKPEKEERGRQTKTTIKKIKRLFAMD